MRFSRQFVERFFDFRKQESGRVLLMSMYLLLIIASYSVSKAVRDALFVTKIGPAQLPYMYLLIAGAMGLVSLVYSRAVNRLGLHRLIRLTSLIAISNLLLFWVLLKNTSAVWFYVLYIWVSLFGAITASQFWLLATHVFDPREARRVFAWIGVGGILGGILGGGLTNRMAHWFGTESLLILCAGMMAVTVMLLERVRPYAEAGEGARSTATSPPARDAVPAGALYRQVWESRHLTMMVLLLSVAVIVEAFVDYEYKFVAKQSISSKDHLTAFFGSVTFYIGLFSLLFQTLLTSRLLKRFGVGLAIMMLPLGLLAASVIFALKPILWTAALLQLVDGGFSYSIHRSGTELLYLPIPPQTRNAVKGFIDMFVDRAGRAIGALLLLLTAFLSLSIASLSLVACGFLIAWIVIVVAVKREYMHSFRQALEKKTIHPEALQLHSLDGGTMKSLLGLLSSQDERQVLYAMDLLSDTHPSRWRDQINLLIQHRSSAIRARAIALLAAWNDPSITSHDVIHHPDYETARVAAASALRLDWSGSYRDRESLSRLLRDPSEAVARQAIVTSGLVSYSDAMPILIEKLADNRLRRDAREALLRLGDVVIPELVRRLSDKSDPVSIRKRIPKALALTGKQKGADALLAQLHRLDYQLDHAVMKALNRMRVNSPEINVDAGVIHHAVAKEHEEFRRMRGFRSWLQANSIQNEVCPLLIRALGERSEERLERIFRLVALIYPPHDVHLVYYNCRVKPALRPSAIEFLDNLLEAPLKEMVVPLLEEVFDPEPGAGVEPQVHYSSHEAALDSLILGEDPWLKAIAAELRERLSNEADRLGVQHETRAG